MASLPFLPKLSLKKSKIILILALCPGIVLPVCAQAPAEEIEYIEKIVVAGNKKLDEKAILERSGLRTGDIITPEGLKDAEERLGGWWRLKSAAIEKRYRSLTEQSGVTLIIRVEEKRVLDDIFIGPALEHTAEYGTGYGVRIRERGRLHHNEVLTITARFGSDQKYGLADEISFSFIPLVHGMRLGYHHVRYTQPFYDIPIRGDLFTIGFFHTWRKSTFAFDILRDNISQDNFPDEKWLKFRLSAMWELGDDDIFPRNGILARLAFLGAQRDGNGKNYVRFSADLREYKEIHNRWVLAFKQILDFSNQALPIYEKPILGGPLTLRGYPVASYIGDNQVLISMESRHPLSRRHSMFRYGIYGFLDGGAVYDHGTGLEQARFHWGTGIGGYFHVFSFDLRADAGWDFDENVEFTFTVSQRF